MLKPIYSYLTYLVCALSGLLSVQPVYGQSFPQPYCDVSFPNAIEPITKVEFAGINNSSPATVSSIGPSLQDFTTISGIVQPGESVPIALEGNTAGSFRCYFQVFIDWNQDGDFFDAEERYDIGYIYNSTGTDGQAAIGTINVPEDALAGTTRMRVVKKYNLPPDACNSEGWGQAEDYTLHVVTDENPSCASISGLQATAITRSTATISWDTPSVIPEEGYEYYVSYTSGIPDATVIPTGQSAGTSVNLDALKAGRTYYVSVRAKCDADTYSSWRLVSFTTTMPWSEKFTAEYNMPTDWWVLSGYWEFYVREQLSPTDGYVISRYFSNNSSGAFATNNIQHIASGDVLQFEYRLGRSAPPFNPPAAGSGNFVVGISTDGGNNFTEIATIPNDGTAGWQLFSYDLSPYAEQTIQVSITVNAIVGSYYIGFDNFYAGPPVCNRVLNVQSSEIGTTTASFSWETPAGNPAEFAYYLSENSNAPVLTTPPTGTTNQTNLALHSLSPGQQYYLWVRSMCGPDDISEWGAIYSFATEYETDRPWSEDFNSSSTPKGWSTPPRWFIDEDSEIPSANGNVLHAVLQNSTLDLSKSFTTPIIKDIQDGDRLSFQYAIKDHVAFGDLARGDFKVAISTDNGENYNNVATVLTYSDSPWQTFFYDLTPYKGKNIKIRIVAQHDIGGYQLGFDSFRIEPAPSCLEVSGVQATNITFTEAKVSWQPAASESYEYFLSTSITGLQEYTGTFTNQTDAEIQFNDLEEGTTYYFWVRNRCDTDEHSAWSSLISFTTLLSTPVPWNESFPTASRPDGWMTDSWLINNSNNFVDKDGAAIYKNIYYSSNFSFSTLYIRDIKAGDVFSFVYQHMNYSSSNAPGNGSGSFTVAISADMGLHYTDVATVANNDIVGWQTFSYPLGAFAEKTIRIRITSSWTAGEYYLGFDNFSIQSGGACPLVQGLTATDLTSNNPVISWDALATAPTGGYDYYYSDVSITPDAIGEPSGNTTNNAVTLPSLSSGKRYYFYVRANCGDDNVGAWSNALSFDLPLAHDGNNIIYVRENGTGNGSSWANAVADLQAAIDLPGVQEVWVAEGTYYAPSTTSFKMKNNVVVYGGFPAIGEPMMRDRKWKEYPTILSGNNERRVINNYFDEINPLENTAIIDGFFIQDGKTESHYIRGRGAGIYNYNASPIMRNLHIRNNVSWHGAGICNESSSPVISDVIITDNHIENNEYMYGGAGITNLYTSNVTIIRAIIENNTGDTRYGGGIFNDYADNITISESIIRNNTLKESVPPEGSNGGGMYNVHSSVLIKNTVITGNKADAGAGISAWNDGNIKLLNVTIAGNIGKYGIAIDNSGGNHIDIINSIIYSNSNEREGTIYNNSNTTQPGFTTIRNSIIKKPTFIFGNWNADWGTNGGGNIVGDPLFNAAAVGDYSLVACSPAVNSGDNQAYIDIAGSADYDLADNPRMYLEGTIDMGAYEFQNEAIDHDQITFVDKEVEYDGTAHGVVAGNIPTGITTNYEITDGNNQVVSEAIQAGIYTVKAIFSGCGADAVKTAKLTIKKAELTITANDRSKTYGDALTLGSTEFTSSGLVNSDAVSSVTLNSTGAAATAVIGDYDITASAAQGTGLDNYTISYAKGTLTVGKKALTITANDRSKTYGDALTLGSVAFTSSGLVNSDAVSSVTLTSAGAAASAVIGDYDITASAAQGTGLDNYTITYVKGTLTVGKKALTITANDRSKIYGDALTLGSTAFTSSGLVNSDAVSSVTLTSAGAAATAVIGDYDITASAAQGTSLDNYTITYVKGTLTVGKKALTITANDRSKIYGDALTLGSTEFTADGLVNSDAVTSVTLTSAGAAATAVIGDYDITVSAAQGTGLDNYDISYAKGTLTVGKKALTITANDRSKTYGDALALGSTAFTSSGLVNSDAVTSVTLSSTGASAAAVVGDYDITVSAAQGTGLDNYDISYAKGTLTVGKKALTITANDRSKTYGDALALGSTAFTSSGLVNSDVVASITLTSAGAAASADVGSYDITASNAQGPKLSNYDISYTKGTLTVGKADPILSGFADITKTYGDADFNLAIPTSSSNGTFSYSSDNPDAATIFGNSGVIITGAGTTTITATQAATSNYNSGSITLELTVDKKALTITADDRSKTYGDALTLGSTAFTSSGLVNNDAVTSVTLTSAGAVATADVDEYDITASAAQGPKLYNYDISYATGALTVGKKGLTITANDRSKTYGETLSLGTTAFEATGLVNNDAVASVTLTSAGAAASADVDMYDIIATDAQGPKLSNYTITYVDGTLTVNKAPQTITFTDPGTLARDAGTIDLDVEASSGLPVDLTIDDDMIATVNSTLLTMTVKRLGTVIITATQEGNHNYLPAEPVSVTIRIVNDGDAALPIRVHQAVSPNGDGINEFLMIEGIRDYPENKVTIFDKSGKVLAEIEGYDNRDRMFPNNRTVRDGTYYYYLDIKDGGEWKREKGYFVVRRSY